MKSMAETSQSGSSYYLREFDYFHATCSLKPETNEITHKSFLRLAVVLVSETLIPESFCVVTTTNYNPVLNTTSVLHMFCDAGGSARFRVLQIVPLRVL